MKTTIERVPTMTLDAFADAHGLEMVVRERGRDFRDGNARFYAMFKDAEVGGDGTLRSVFGNGTSPEAAIHAYASEISQRHLVIDAFSPTRREIDVPRLV